VSSTRLDLVEQDDRSHPCAVGGTAENSEGRSRSWMRQGGGAGMIVVVVLELLYA
jgi:hypothetical protein